MHDGAYPGLPGTHCVLPQLMTCRLAFPSSQLFHDSDRRMPSPVARFRWSGSLSFVLIRFLHLCSLWQPKDRDEDGMVWSSPIIPFDVRHPADWTLELLST